MERFQVAHIHEQGVDLIIIPVNDNFRYKSNLEQNQVRSALQLCAASAGLRGTVVPVWDAGGGRMGFLAPSNFHPFFTSINLAFVAANINRELSCGG
jgi:hypothetical protein